MVSAQNVIAMSHKYWLSLLVSTTIIFTAEAWSSTVPPRSGTAPATVSKSSDWRQDCAVPRAETELAINNVRARLRQGGDLWWDGSYGKYIVPRVPEGSNLPEVSSIYAAALWVIGVDPGNNLKVAAQTYGRAGDETDYWPGPLTDYSETTVENCGNWDRFFSVSGAAIREHRRRWAAAVAANGGDFEGVMLDPATIPEEIRGWPAVGNPFFEDVHGFALPEERLGFAGLADFWDEGGIAGAYEPHLGDFPVVDICWRAQATIPDQLDFWIFNDAAGAHANSGGDAIGMEIHAEAFAFKDNSHLNNTTFQKYRLINRSIEHLNEARVGLWVDPDLGCFQDDFIGCDSLRDLAYVYNADALDGGQDCTDCHGVATYCTDIPILGIDLVSGPYGELGEQLGMSSFSYYGLVGQGALSPLSDPQTPIEYYNYLRGRWRDGTQMTWGGTGYDPASDQFTQHALTGAPNDPLGWSMCQENLGPTDVDPKMILGTGPLRISPGSINELTYSIIWVPELEYPCPDISRLLSADDQIQSMFHNCFELTTPGPEHPDVKWVELDGELIALLEDEILFGGESLEDYVRQDPRSPGYFDSTYYKFEGYQIFQVPRAEVPTDLSDPDQARLVAQTDVKNGITEIYNWQAVPNPNQDVPGEPEVTFVPELMVSGEDKGIRHSLRITEDAFGGGPLINHRTYHYVVRSYAHNNWLPFKFENGLAEGQQTPFITRPIAQTYSVVPRPLVDQRLRSQFGEGPTVTRLDGAGVGDIFVEWSPETYEAILAGSADGRLAYAPGQGPIKVEVFHPLRIVEGTFRLAIRDDNMEDDVLAPDARWELTDVATGEVIAQHTELDQLNEQLVDDYGFSISVAQTADAGDGPNNNGVLGMEVSYADPDGPQWFSGIVDGEGPFNFVATEAGGPDHFRDPEEAFTKIPEPAYWQPFTLTRNFSPIQSVITPMLDDQLRVPVLKLNSPLQQLNNIDVVLTKDKSKWSRCVVVETASRWHTSELYANLPTQGGSKMLRPREARSILPYADADGKPQLDPNESRSGFGWFPGYAVDVETGERLNIFFGENSTYACGAVTFLGRGDLCGRLPNNGRDLLWNPTDDLVIDANLTGESDDLYSYIAGGQHYIYVTNQTYDGCESLYAALEQGSWTMTNTLAEAVTWTCIPLASGLDPLGSGETGLIPNDVTFKIRVSNPYRVSAVKGENQGYPLYEFSFRDVAAEPLVGDAADEAALAQVRVVPNPYYYYSVYENSTSENIVKITNLPARCEVSIYSLDGRLVRFFRRNETVPAHEATDQIYPDLRWDLKNQGGRPVSSGTYLVHVKTEDRGERVLKAFVVQRPL